MATKLEKIERFRKEPLALVVSPLKFLKQALTETVQNAKGQWVTRLNKKYYEAAEAARQGNGKKVQRMALELFS